MLSHYLPTKPAFRLESLARASRNHLPHDRLNRRPACGASVLKPMLDGDPH